MEANRSRAAGAGLDPCEYRRVTGPLGALTEWPAAFRAAARAHVAAAEHAEARGRTVSAGESYGLAARWFHFAAVLPHPDRDDAGRTARAADDAMRRALAHLDPDAVRIETPSFVGWLRRPAGAGRPPVVVLVPGLDSGKEEFHGVTDALLRRGLAVFAMDGPGQGLLAGATAVRPDYHRVLTGVIDALAARPEVDAARVGVIGLSLGGFYAAQGAAHEPRIRATATVSGPYRLDWDELPPLVTDTLVQRAHGLDAAREFADRVDLREMARRIAGPLLVVDGGQDVIPGCTNGERLAREAARGEYLLVPHGDHLLGNARAAWLPATADWLAEHLGRS
ncbi:hypothetical protein A6A07_24610 [Streptomyces sp. CB03911]|nr:hypothetical protein A6A07_24610 [Streptomyces sp. CB03911]